MGVNFRQFLYTHCHFVERKWFSVMNRSRNIRMANIIGGKPTVYNEYAHLVSLSFFYSEK